MADYMEQVALPIERMLEEFKVSSVFGEVIREGEMAVVPVAEVTGAFGYGYGSGEGPAPDSDGLDAQRASGGGGGGGGRGTARPRGYLTITADGVRYEPMVDPVKMALGGMALVAWMIFWAALVIRAFVKD